VRILPLTSLNSLRAISRSKLSKRDSSRVLDEIEHSLLLLKSEIVPGNTREVQDFLEVENNDQAIVAYGRIVVELSKLVHLSTLTEINNALRMDQLYFSGHVVNSTLGKDSSNNHIANQLKQISKQLVSVEHWLGD
tara:strand:- start:13638 stop:14045 length:408 start_codon:yes stop_codon:yes gene_type:complete